MRSRRTEDVWEQDLRGNRKWARCGSAGVAQGRMLTGLRMFRKWGSDRNCLGQAKGMYTGR